LNAKTTFIAKKYHVSWMLAVMSMGILLGAFLSLYSLSFARPEWLVVGLCLIFVAIKNGKFIGICLALIAGTVFGLWRGGVLLQSQTPYEQFIGQEVAVSGRIAEDPSYGTDGTIKFELKNVFVDDLPVGGQIWVSTDDRALIKRSDDVQIYGRLSSGFGNIPVAVYRAEILKVERQDYVDVGRDVRDYFAEGVRQAVPEPEASLGTGFLLGQKTALPEKLENELMLLGLTHIVVASGYNLTILIRFARRRFARISRFTALAGSLGFVYFFLQITGNSPSMARASLVAVISLFAWFYGRKIHPLVLLPISAAATVIINPAYVWGDVGWLLSYTSFIGVIMLSPLIHKYFWGDKKPGNIRAVFFETMSAQVWTFPIVAYVFGQYSPLALPANLLILPLIPLAMALTAVAGVAGIFLGAGAMIVGFPATAVLSYMVAVVNFLAQLPAATAEIEFNMTALIVSYILIVTTMIFLWRKTGHKFRDYNIIE
jgi:competence protein ComEC